MRREVDANDQRITRVFLTAEGRRQELEHRAAFEDYVNQTIGKLSDQDKLELTRLLDEVSGHIAELVCAGGARARGAGRRETASAHLSASLPVAHRRSSSCWCCVQCDRQPVPAHAQRRHHQQRRRQGRHRLHPAHRPHHARRRAAHHRLLDHLRVQRGEDGHGHWGAT